MRMIIGITGEMGCGKGTATKYIQEKYNAESYRFSTILRDAMDRLCIEQSRENISKFSTMLRQNFGEDLFAKVMARDVEKDSAEIIAIDGIRRPGDIEYLKKMPEFKLVYIEADIKNCYERIVGRGENSNDSSKTFEEFVEDHNLEADVQIKNLKKQADFVIDNNNDFKYFFEQIDKIIKNN